MKVLLVLQILIFSISISNCSYAQISELNYCGHKFEIEGDCKAESKFELICDDFALQWMYMDKDMLDFMPDKIISELEGNIVNSHKEEIKLYSMGVKFKSWLYTYDSNGKERFHIVSYGTIENQPVLLNIGLTIDPKRNDNLPKMVSHLITINDNPMVK